MNNKEKIETKSVKELEEIMGDAYTTDSVKVAFKEGYNTAKREDKTLRQEWERETEKRFEIAARLYLQDMWNDQSEIQALSPEDKTIIWGGKIGKTITEEWKKIKAKFLESETYLQEKEGE